MATAGFTHGGFYKHFDSKAELMAEAAARGLSQAVTSTEGLDVAEFFKRYLSRKHRDARSVGCTMAALGGDAARQSDHVKATFAAGIESVLAALGLDGAIPGDVDQRSVRTKMIGALVLSRCCPDDSSLSDEILNVCRKQILAPLSSAGATTPERSHGP